MVSNVTSSSVVVVAGHRRKKQRSRSNHNHHNQCSICLIPVVVICAAILVTPSTCGEDQSSMAAATENYGSYRDRTIGCLVADDICHDNEICFDDQAFGRCEEYDPLTGSVSSRHIYQLDRKTRTMLETEMERLSAIRPPVSWHHPYVQCTMKSLLNDRPRTVFDPSKCERFFQQYPSSSSVATDDDNANLDDDNLFSTGNMFLLKQNPELTRNKKPKIANRQQDAQPVTTTTTTTTDLNKETLQIVPPGSFPTGSPVRPAASKPSSKSLPFTSNNNDDGDDSNRQPWKRRTNDDQDFSKSRSFSNQPNMVEYLRQLIEDKNDNNNQHNNQDLRKLLLINEEESSSPPATDSNPTEPLIIDDEEPTAAILNEILSMQQRSVRDTSGYDLDLENFRTDRDDSDDGLFLIDLDDDLGPVAVAELPTGQPTPAHKKPQDFDYSLDGDMLNELFDQYGTSQQDDSNVDDDDLMTATLPLQDYRHHQNADDENEDDDEQEDEDKEILLDADLGYGNNYLLPVNFYRNHRYDIKKPGPRYFEEYFSSNVDDSKSKSTPAPGMDTKPATDKKAFSILSHKPVSEGPVKVEGGRADASGDDSSLIIRTAAKGEPTNLEAIDSSHAYVVTDRMLGEEDSERFLQKIEQIFELPKGTFSNMRKENYQITFKVNPNYLELNASQVAARIEDSAQLIQQVSGFQIRETGIGDRMKLPVVSPLMEQEENDRMVRTTVLVCILILSSITGAFILFLFRRNSRFRESIKRVMKLSEDWTKFDYQDLCRQRFKNKQQSQPAQSETDVEKEGLKRKDSPGRIKNVDTTTASQHGGSDHNGSPQSRSSTSSWVEEPVSSHMDITTGHIILSYMEDHLKNKDRLDKEWEALCAYEADPCSTSAALQKQNASKNRYPTVLPYDHSRVILNDVANVANSDYINASTITDHDPRNPAYIATQGPLATTKADFWQMVWEQGSLIIVMLTRLRENGLNMCDRYWPEEGSEKYGNYEVHLVSEHIWCDDYLVRSFYLKNLTNGETRTVAQFHYLSWPENGTPPNTKSVLDFRRKVNKSYRGGRACPMVVHCNDGAGRTGTYILIDMVLNRLAKGAKEIDLAASLEHIRDQRMAMVKTKQQFEFVLLAVADEVQAILKALAASTTTTTTAVANNNNNNHNPAAAN